MKIEGNEIPRMVTVKEFGYFQIKNCSFGNGKFMILETESTFTEDCIIKTISSLTKSGLFHIILFSGMLRLKDKRFLSARTDINFQIDETSSKKRRNESEDENEENEEKIEEESDDNSSNTSSDYATMF